MQPDCLFSIIVLVRGGSHLLTSTLDTLKAQAEKDFEVVLIDGSSSGRLQELGEHYPELRLQIHQMAGATPSEMMNEGMRRSRGKYVQFLDAGDRFISQQGLSYVKELIRDSQEPHIAYSGFVRRGPDAPPQAMTFPLNLQALRQGTFPTVARCAWFLKQAVEDLGGFDGRLVYRSAFDLLCRLFLKKEIRAVYSRRVLTDSDPQRTSPGEIVGYAAETYRILYHHFGLWYALRWIFVQDHLQMVRWSWRLLKQAFAKRD